MIDAKQRPISVNTVTQPAKPKVCLARSADALSQAAASGNLSITQESGAGGQLALASSEQAMSIAFRTQVTEAQQEFLYYLCQLNSNGALSDDEVSDNLRHFQNTMLAMVAVDDLATAAKSSPPPAAPAADTNTEKPVKPAAPAPASTRAGAVAAAQNGVDNAKNAEKSADNKVQQSFKAVSFAAAPADLKDSPKTFLSSLKTFDAKEQAYAKAINKLQTAIKAAKGTDATIPDGVTSTSTASDDAAKDVKSTYPKVVDAVKPVSEAVDAAALKTAQGNLSTAFDAYRAADKKYEAALDKYAAANKSWAAETKAADGKDKDTSKSQDEPKATPNPSAATANAVAIIVQTVVWQSFTTEKCQKTLFAREKSVFDDRVLTFCLEHLKRADDFRFEARKIRQGSGLPATPEQPLELYKTQ